MKYEEEITYVLEHGRFSGSRVQSIMKSVLLFLFSLLCLTGAGTIIWFLVTTETYRLKEIAGPIILILVALFYGFSILFGLKNEWTADKNFQEFRTQLSVKQNLQFMTKLLKDRFRVKAIEVDDENNVVSALTKISLLTWGETITVVCDNNRVLVNSKSGGSQPFSYGQNKRNVLAIEEEIKNTVANKT